MAEPEHSERHEEDDESTPGYKPPAPASLDAMLSKDTEDESLRKYKEALLGNISGGDVVFFPNDPRRVIVTKLTLVVEGRADVDLDLTGDLTKLKEQSFVIKEGCQYRLRVSFYVQREIVTGLKLVQKTYRNHIKVDTTTHMVGSYGPKREIQSFLTPVDDAPSGLLMRGHYNVTSLFTDDDKHEYLKWDWSFTIKKDWDE